MSLHLPVYQPATSCTGAASPGGKALMAWFLGAYGPRGGRNGGIYGCRVIAGTRTLSVHAEGRADDLMIPVGAAWGQPLMDALVSQSRELGIQLIIFRGRVWSSRYPTAGWRKYDGDNPHNDHGHVELDRYAAAHLTVAAINSVMSQTRTELLMLSLPTLRKTASTTPNQYVKNAQSLLNAHGAKLDVDGEFGTNTENAVKAFQTTRKLKVDGVIGVAQTWPALLDVH